MFKIIGISLLSIVAIFALAWIVQGNNFFMYKYFAPKYEDARREVFENTQSYVEGKKQDLIKYRLEYMKSKDPVEKSAIKMTIVQAFANFDENKLDGELKDFLHKMKFE